MVFQHSITVKQNKVELFGSKLLKAFRHSNILAQVLLSTVQLPTTEQNACPHSKVPKCMSPQQNKVLVPTTKQNAWCS
jgi:hypothetical protein